MKRPPNRRKKTDGRKLQKNTEMLHFFNIQITFDEDFHPHGYEITEEIADAVNTYRVVCKKQPKKAVRELPAVIERLPQVPQLRNHLFTALQHLGRYDEAYAVNDTALRDHPDYIYAVMNKAIQYWKKNELDAVKELLGGMPLVINRTFPKRKKFHFAEVYGYYSFLIRFLVTKGNPVAAMSHYKFLEELLPDHPELPELKNMIDLSNLREVVGKLMENIEKSKARRRKRKKSTVAQKSKKKGNPKLEDLFRKKKT